MAIGAGWSGRTSGPTCDGPAPRTTVGGPVTAVTVGSGWQGVLGAMVPGGGFAGTGGSGRVGSGDGWCGAVAAAAGYSTTPIRSRRSVVHGRARARAGRPPRAA